MIGYILQTENGEEYIGITNDFARRRREHRHSGPLKGLNITVLRIETFDNFTEAATWEIAQIAARPNCLNTSLGGYGGRRGPRSQAEKSKLSDLAKARSENPEYRAKLSAGCKAAWSDPEARKGQSSRAVDSCRKPEVKRRRSSSQKIAWQDPEVRARRIAAIKAQRNDPAKAEARSAAAKKMWKTRRALKEAAA